MIGFGAEPLGDFGIVQLGVEDFDRDFAMQRLVDGAVDRAHAAAADAIQDAVLADVLPDHDPLNLEEIAAGSRRPGVSSRALQLESAWRDPAGSRAERRRFHFRLDALVGRAGDHNLARAGHFVLDTGRGVDDVAQNREFAAPGRSDVARQRDARVDGDPHL